MSAKSNKERTDLLQIVTPEGVPLEFTIAGGGERLGAFLIDALFLFLGLVALVVVCTVLAFVSGSEPGWAFAVAIVGLFLARSFYFAFFEIRWQGRTPGKRRSHVRVIDRRGGQLRAEAVLTRNFLREAELFVPLTLLFQSKGTEGLPLWGRAALAAWPILMLLFPLFNRQRLRIGDLIAGTVVIREPQHKLLADVTAIRATPIQSERPGAAAVITPLYTFTPEQLSHYGVYELQVLEQLLRSSGDPTRQKAKKLAAEKIAQKIGWGAYHDQLSTHRFLEDFYTAQRRHLEQRMLFGERKERKSSGPPALPKKPRRSR